MAKERDFRKEEWVTMKVYSKDVIWIEQWKIWERVFKKVGKELAKIEVSFSREKTLKGG